MAGDSTFACMTWRQAMARLSADGNLSYQIDSWLRMIYMDLNVFLLSVRYEAVASSYQNLGLYGQVKVRSFIWVTMRHDLPRLLRRA
jgi:hypothetical protein